MRHFSFYSFQWSSIAFQVKSKLLHTVLRFYRTSSLLTLQPHFSHICPHVPHSNNNEFSILRSHNFFRSFQLPLMGPFFTLLHRVGSSFRFSLDSTSSGNLPILVRTRYQPMLYWAQHITSHTALTLFVYILSPEDGKLPKTIYFVPLWYSQYLADIILILHLIFSI